MAAIHFTSRMDLLSQAYVEAVAASIGAQIAYTKIDHESVDGTFYSGIGKCPRIDFQLKSSGAYSFDTTNETLSFPLPVKNYNDLRKSERFSPIILILLVMPPDQKDWLAHGHEALSIRNCAYWRTLVNAPDTTNTSTVSVAIDKKAFLSPEVLHELLTKAENGEAL